MDKINKFKNKIYEIIILDYKPDPDPLVVISIMSLKETAAVKMGC